VLCGGGGHHGGGSAGCWGVLGVGQLSAAMGRAGGGWWVFNNNNANVTDSEIRIFLGPASASDAMWNGYVIAGGDTRQSPPGLTSLSYLKKFAAVLNTVKRKT